MAAGELPQPAAPEAPFAGELLFDALLTPHRSLGRRGFLLLMWSLAGLSLGASLVFFLIGAWPVIGFFGLDLALLYLVFRVNYCRARQYERVRLSPRQLRIDKVTHHGRKRSFVFEPYWVRVEMREPAEPDTPLHLASHGRRLTVGSFLSAEERLDFARALQRALRQAHQPGVT
ncbi:MAG: DUF2244 domain-containing protein [Rhodospirillales bacterium]